MTVQDFTALSSHEIARAEIEAWRGECLDLFTQGEAMVGAVLELAQKRGYEVQLHQFASQRTLEVMRLVDMVGGTDEETQDANTAILAWQAVESRGEMLAQGTVKTALDRNQQWYAIIDIVTYRGGKANKGRWVVNRPETEEFQKQLFRAFAKLKIQLGCLRLRVDD
ncbi:MAG TPA: hypothetical protein VLA37_04855 [Sphingomonadaceae bacterium]|nr:hypothetical protein [Sphingomonadaceae bacterium]